MTLGLDINEGNIGDALIIFGKTNDHKIGHLVMGTIPEDAVGINAFGTQAKDRGFASWKLMDEMCKRNTFMTDEEICEAYRLGWRIELLWKALKMHLKSDRIITKNESGYRLMPY